MNKKIIKVLDEQGTLEQLNCSRPRLKKYLEQLKQEGVILDFSYEIVIEIDNSCLTKEVSDFFKEETNHPDYTVDAFFGGSID